MKTVFVLLTTFFIFFTSHMNAGASDDIGDSDTKTDDVSILTKELPEEIAPAEEEEEIIEEIKETEKAVTTKSQDDAVSPAPEEKTSPAIESQEDTFPVQRNNSETKYQKSSSEKLNEQDKISQEKDFSIRINEILANPNGSDSGKEFIELHNFGDAPISLKDWRLYDKTKKYYIFGDVDIKSGEYLTLFNKADFSFSLNNSNEELTLEDANEKIISQYSYKNSTSGLSWNYGDTWYQEEPTPDQENTENPLTKDYPEILLNEAFPNPKESEEEHEFIELYNPNDIDVSLKNWILSDASQSGKHVIGDIIIPAKKYLTLYRTDFSFALNNSGNEIISLTAPNDKITSSMTYTSSREGFSLNRDKKWYWEKPTPDKENRENPLTKSYLQLFLSEILPNPSGDESKDEFIEIYNPNDSPADLENWTLSDASSSGTYTFFESLIIDPKSHIVIYRREFLFALNNSNELLSLIAPNEKTVSTLSYESSREDVSYNYDRVKKQWRQSKHLTPGKENIYNNLPEITKFDIDKKIYKDVYAEFEAKAHDKDGEKLKVRWDFGDGRKSYLWKTRHNYTETGVYHGALRIQDESEEVVKKFTVTVKKYPKHKIKIVKIVPNPAGKDSGNEYLVIKNTSDEKINLKNWSIATGAKEKTLVNHPIYDDLTIKPGKLQIIKKKYSAISLPNKKGVIEVRRPNGSVSHKKKYGEKDLSIPDNASYEKIDDVWQWIIPENLEELAQIQEIIAQALLNESKRHYTLLESEVAFSAIHEPQEKPESRKNENTNFLMSHSYLTLNGFLNQFTSFLQKQDFSIKFLEKTENVGSIHIIKSHHNPCETFSLQYDQKYSLCK